MRTKAKDDVVPFRVAMMLKRYRFGSNIIARYLNKPRGLVQSWMQADESHVLAEEQFKMGAFENKLRNVRKNITQENLYHLLALKLLDLKLPPEYIGRHLGLPPSTVRSWKEGVSPKSVNKLFVDRSLLDKEFKKLMQFLRFQSTQENLSYYLSIELSERARQKVGRRRIGGKTIGQVLTKHFNLSRPLPKETITCWIDGRRRPKNAFEVLKDKELIDEVYKKLVDNLTDEHMDYHIAKALYNKYDWSYSNISKSLGIDKEKVRGWVVKDRGSPIAKCFVNEDRVDEALKKYLDETMYNGGGIKVHEEVSDAIKEEPNIDAELEDEILYHLSFFPSGISSPQALKSILIENKGSDIQEILEVLNNSPGIVRKGRRWVLKEYAEGKPPQWP